jgi:hypothetical protein
MTTFDDLTYARTLMADREREADRARLGRLARIARAAASCCEGRTAAFRRLLSRRSGGASPRATAAL